MSLASRLLLLPARTLLLALLLRLQLTTPPRDALLEQIVRAHCAGATNGNRGAAVPPVQSCMALQEWESLCKVVVSVGARP